MSWVEGLPRKTPLIDYNEEFSQLDGELNEDQARKTFGRFLMYNIGYFIEMMTGFRLYPSQRLVIKGWLLKNFSLCIASRGYGKSLLFSHFCWLYCLMNPGKRIVMVSATFRSSRKIVENIDEWARSDRGTLLRATIEMQPHGQLIKKRQDLYEIEFKNGSSIIALPLGDSEKLRGYRCSVLGIDEGLLIPQSIIDSVLKPFLVAVPKNEIKRRQTIREKETRKIKAGKMKEEQRTKFGSDSKMIILSSASYAWQDLFQLYKRYRTIVNTQDDSIMKTLDDEDKKLLAADKSAKVDEIEGVDIPATYLVQQISWHLIHPDAIDSAMREEIEGKAMSESVRRREYGAEFVQDSEGFYSARIMEECTLKGDKAPTVEIIGEKGAEYLLSIDPNMAASITNDHFAMCVIKIVDKKTDEGNKKIGMVVHQYANAGAKPEHHIAYLHYILTHFNIVYIALDTSQGDNFDFINICNETELFKREKIKLLPIDADFGKETFDDVVPQIQKSYNKAERRIVQKQYFHSAFQKAANDHMQTCFGNRSLLFAAKALASTDALDTMREQDVGSIVSQHPMFTDSVGQPGSKDDFITLQDVFLDLVKTECAIIEIKTSSLGIASFDMPAHMKKKKDNPKRVRKDNYSALVLGNWALKLYLEAQLRPQEVKESPFYFAVAVPR